MGIPFNRVCRFRYTAKARRFAFGFFSSPCFPLQESRKLERNLENYKIYSHQISTYPSIMAAAPRRHNFTPLSKQIRIVEK